MNFQLVSPFKPTGDQPQAIRKLTDNYKKGVKHQVLLGVTGSGKTFTMANIIQNVQKPTLVISHNKTLAGQLYQEFKEFFPNNAVSYFVSYYDYYQPEAYIAHSDTYIEKEVEINQEIDKLRLFATTNLMTRKDVIVVASVSCIYNIGSPAEYGKFILELKPGLKLSLRDIQLRLVDLQYEKNDYSFQRGTFRLRGNSIDLLPSYSDSAVKIQTDSDKITAIYEFDPLTGEKTKNLNYGTVIYPAKHFMTDPANYGSVFTQIRKDLAMRTDKLRKANKLLEADRLTKRVRYDLDMIREVGYVNGIENYSRYFDGRKPGQPPFSLLDYFEQASDDFLTIIDESHMTLPQIRGMYNGDRARKEVLVNYGFRLPSAFDNRPLRYDEFMQRVHKSVYVSATPNEYEISLAKEFPDAIAEQLIRPTGLVDPKVSVRPTKGQIDDLIKEIEKRAKKGERTLVTTLTKRMAEDLTTYLAERDVKVAYLHSDIETLDRQDVIDALRSGEHDVIVGINLLWEGLDLPEVSLVAILDADKEGFLRSRTSLVQTMGRAARNMDGEVIMYADMETGSMREAIKEVERRRQVQIGYNKKHGITPQSIRKTIRAKLVEREKEEKNLNIDFLLEMGNKEVLLPDERETVIKRLSSEMRHAAKDLDFETAALLRDRIRFIKTSQS
ncbi:MAG: excinuclease ABC subunit UvrB [Candidatus Levybacteria bacterium]|nr:excinuclease ABC subunit UvrB [Candidatus Levybacteria bacterium]